MRVEGCYEHYIMYVTFKQFLNQNGYKLGYLKDSNAAAYFVDSDTVSQWFIYNFMHDQWRGVTRTSDIKAHGDLNYSMLNKKWYLSTLQYLDKIAKISCGNCREYKSNL